MLTAEQVRASRALLRWDQKTLATAAGVSVETVKRIEAMTGLISANSGTLNALQKALEAAGVIFIEENGGGPGVRLKKRQS